MIDLISQDSLPLAGRVAPLGAQRRSRAGVGEAASASLPLPPPLSPPRKGEGDLTDSSRLRVEAGP